MKSRFVSFRISEGELRRLNDATSRTSLSRSEFIRKSIFQNLEEEKRNPGD